MLGSIDLEISKQGGWPPGSGPHCVATHSGAWPALGKDNQAGNYFTFQDSEQKDPLPFPLSKVSREEASPLM